MRIRIAHETTFSYDPPARFIIQNLRLTPRSFDSQYVMRWRLNVDIDTGSRLSEDCFGNVVSCFSYQKPVECFTVSAIGEIETTDAVGVVRGAGAAGPTGPRGSSSARSARDGAAGALRGPWTAPRLQRPRGGTLRSPRGARRALRAMQRRAFHGAGQSVEHVLRGSPWLGHLA